MSLLLAPLGLGLAVAWLELRHRLRPASPLRMTPRDWRVDDLGGRLRIEGVLEISNPHPRMEIFVPELRVEPVLLGSSDPAGLEVKTRIIADHPDEETRADGYWAAYIVKGRKTTRARVSIEITGPTPSARVDSLWVDAHWVNYGPFGRLQRRQGVLVPLSRPEPLQPDQAHFRQGEGCRVLPLRT
ncbi:MAG: F420-0:Gamma-glutamyl ligase, partial [Cyanobacteria bacterium MAG COS1_bin_9]|nr:F420-0:Gamma-glutamyl ligase [Cyanobacteria bacterium MAG COS1_bin_9]